MNRSQQLVDEDTGEVLSHKTIPNNRDFVMTYRSGYRKLREVGLKDAKALILLNFLLEHMDTENALIVSRQALAEYFDWSEATVKRKVKILRDEKCIDVKKTGTSNCYLVNANIAWTTYADKRKYAHFRANVFVSESEQPEEKGKNPEDVKTERHKQVHVKDE